MDQLRRKSVRVLRRLSRRPAVWHDFDDGSVDGQEMRDVLLSLYADGLISVTDHSQPVPNLKDELFIYDPFEIRITEAGRSKLEFQIKNDLRWRITTAIAVLALVSAWRQELLLLLRWLLLPN